MAYLTQYQYYENAGLIPADENWGSYQYVGLKDIVNNFRLIYQDELSLTNNENRYKILFHAKRAIQELNYDAFKEIKVLQLSISDQLRFILPSDYVNWVRISKYENGLLYPLTENIQINSATSYLQDNEYNILFDEAGNALSPENSNIDIDRIRGSKKTIYLNKGNQFDGSEGYCCDGMWYFDYAIGARYGLNTETANQNPTFRIDKKAGVINFESTMAGKSVVLEYVSDGMEGGDVALITVNKMFEEYIYAAIKYAILNARTGIFEYIVTRSKKDKAALLRNAKIRISNIHPGRLLMNMRGRDKWIK